MSISLLVIGKAERLASRQVPLQYSNPDGDQGAVALIMSPSNYSAGDENYLGPILFNPGMLSIYQRVFLAHRTKGDLAVRVSTTSSPMASYFVKCLDLSLISLVSTRGVSYSTRRSIQDKLMLSGAGVGQTTPNLTIFKDAAEAAQVLSPYAVNANESVSSIGRNFALFGIMNNLASDRVKNLAESVGTPAVARDMLSIVEAFGQDKLQYWGVS